MNSTLTKINDNIAQIIQGSLYVEGIDCTLAQTDEIIRKGTSAGLTDYEITVVLNIKRAYQFLFENYGYPVELGTCYEYNWIIGQNDVTRNPGYIRGDYPIRVSGVLGTPAPIYDEEARILINDGERYDNPYEQAIYHIAIIHRRQFFCDGNKRTAIMVANHTMALYDTGSIFAPTNIDEADHFRQILCEYENNSMNFAEFFKECRRFFW